MIEPFMNRFASNLNFRLKIKCLQIKIKCFQNGSQDIGQDGCSKLELPIFEPFINRFGSNLNLWRKIK